MANIQNVHETYANFGFETQLVALTRGQKLMIEGKLPFFNKDMLGIRYAAYLAMIK